MKLLKRILDFAPIETDFKPSDIANEVFPNLVRRTKSGATFNQGCSVIARVLRKTNFVLEVSPSLFWIDRQILKS